MNLSYLESQIIQLEKSSYAKSTEEIRKVQNKLEGQNLLNKLEGQNLLNKLEGQNLLNKLEGQNLLNKLEGFSVLSLEITQGSTRKRAQRSVSQLAQRTVPTISAYCP